MEEQVTMTPEERAEFEAFKAEQARKRAEEEKKQQREEYAQLVDTEVVSAVEQLVELSERMQMLKKIIFENFQTLINMKREIMGVKRGGEQFTHAFTTSGSTMRITIGNRTIDGYLDSVEEGIAIVTEYIQSLVKDEESRDLVDTVMRLMERNKKGAIHPSRVLQLRQLAERRKNPRFLEGVRIIEESYLPAPSKTFVKCEIKGDEGWRIVPLSMTDC